jgi:hypothetical protein
MGTDAIARHPAQTAEKKGPGRRSNHQRWPTAFFAERGTVFADSGAQPVQDASMSARECGDAVLGEKIRMEDMVAGRGDV